MKKSIFIILAILTLSVLSCKKENTTSATPQLLFKSGFEGVTLDADAINEDNADYRFIRGTDSETGYSWPIDILGAKESGMHYIEDDSHQAVFAELQTVTGHNGTPTTALYMQQNYNNEITQCPYEILDIKDNGRKDLYIKYWLKIDSTSLSQTDKWRAIFEYKTVGYAKGTGFRLIAYIYTDENGNPYWHFQGDKKPKSPLWERDNFDIPVPKNEWFKTEFYWRWGDKKEGRAWWKINDQVIADVQGATTRNNKPIDFIILTQIYGDANPKHQWVDDIEIWEGMP